MAAFPGVDLRELATRWDEGLDVSDITVYAITDEAFPGPGGVNGEPSNFVKVNYMSVVPGKNGAYEEMESKYFKPVHQAAAKAGYMNDWVLAERVMPYGSDYDDDYITVDMYDKWSDLAAGGMGKLFSQVHPNENIGDVFNDIAALRDLKRSEVWERLMYVNSPPEEVSYNVIKEGSGYAPSPGQEVAFNVKTVNNEGEVICNSRELGFPFYSTIDESPTDFFDKGMLQLKKGGVMEMTVPYDLLGDSDKEQANHQAVVVTIELVDFGAPARNGADLLHSTFNEQGLPAAKALYQKLQNDNPEGYAFREGWMNNLGYILMEEGNNDAAIYIFQTNQKNFPKSWNCYDSLADGHRAAGNISEAKKYYKKALQLNPDF
ncbi:MAG: tetratricopeptide repeat protein, partial [Bacteroidetes bacterium]